MAIVIIIVVVFVIIVVVVVTAVITPFLASGEDRPFQQVSAPCHYLSTALL